MWLPAKCLSFFDHPGKDPKKKLSPAKNSDRACVMCNAANLKNKKSIDKQFGYCGKSKSKHLNIGALANP